MKIALGGMGKEEHQKTDGLEEDGDGAFSSKSISRKLGIWSWMLCSRHVGYIVAILLRIPPSPWNL